AFEKALQFRPQYFDGLVYAAHAKVLQFMKAPSPKPREYERRLDDALRWMIQAKSGRRATWRTYYACGAFHVAAAAFWHPDEVAHARCDLRAHGIEDLQRAEKMAPGELEPVVCQVWASEDAAKCAVARKEDPRAVLTVGEGAIDRLQARRHQLPIRDLNLIGNFYGAVSVIERERGDVDRARGLLESAIRYHEQVVVAVPDEPYALYQLGVKFDDLRALTQDPEKKKGLQDRAERAWGRLVDLHVFLDWAYDRRGKIYQERAEQDPGRAVEWLRRAVAEHERRVRAFPDQPGFRKDLEAVEALLKAKRGS
ncbi:MAG: hypothetical protein HYY16_13285, partial [Planctomycetes bacterium]|nr:hypothetical protein [Planctomycetota bacterium]